MKALSQPGPSSQATMSTRTRKAAEIASHKAAPSAPAAPAAPAAVAIAQAPTAGFVIQCSIVSELLETDEGCFEDLWGEEIDAAERDADDSATGRDGTWLWDTAKSEHTAGLAGGPRRPVLFTSVKTANAAAAEVWVALLQTFERPCTPLSDQLSKQVKGRTSSSGSKKAKADAAALTQKQSQGAAKQRSGGKGQGKAGGDAAVAVEQQLQEMFGQPMKVLSGGRGSWKAAVQWFDDPFDQEEPLENVVRSTVVVEVVQAECR